MDTTLELGLIEADHEGAEVQAFSSLTDLQLALVGGGSGDVIFA